MTRQSGLTLLEVLFSVTLLSLVVVSALPMLLRAELVFRVGPPSYTVTELGVRADEFLNAPKQYGYEVPHRSGSFPWSDTDPTEVRFEALQASEECSYQWLVFTSHEASVLRIARKPE